MVERLGKFYELVALVELELMFRSVGILKTRKSYNGLSIQDYKYWSKDCSSTAFHMA